ncbi:hypothetical protein BIV57_20345 [Mangrovactinospora gilvigrisea]|uniref:Integral membrane protein n=1 Tax=Mangrovactinospora gilvigrisea TaxID=1428644 RepID=A0A1J7BAM6_9ACTN|nr:DUF6114 domain-containing protein [Mangrovactinospora gilvigrisea]OIV35670.1 hypothetical protein BIV57_20345 [Mangrovactinospora gilvigrisea]
MGPALGRWRRGFRAWRSGRPFWAGLLILLAGGPILYFPYAHIQLGSLTVAMSTVSGAGSLVIGLLLIVLGITVWFQPLVRVFVGVATIILSLVALVISNFGGFGLGLILGLLGGALAIAWTFDKAAPEPAAPAPASDSGPESTTVGPGSE